MFKYFAILNSPFDLLHTGHPVCLFNKLSGVAFHFEPHIKHLQFIFVLLFIYSPLTEIFSLTSTHLMKGEKLGTINTTDFELIRSTVCGYPNANPHKLKSFGLI